MAKQTKMQNLSKVKTELVTDQINLSSMEHIQVFRKKDGTITWAILYNNSYRPDPENPNKEHPDTIGFLNYVDTDQIAEGIQYVGKDKIFLNADVWADWESDFGPTVIDAQFGKIYRTNLQTFLNLTEVVENWDFGFDLIDTPRTGDSRCV